MRKIHNAIFDIHYLDEVSAREKWVNSLHPLCKLIVTICYILTVLSFGKYEITGLLGMVVYPAAILGVTGISLKRSLGQLWPVLILVCAVGITNPYFDRDIVFFVGGIGITGGWISMFTLMQKGIYAVMASYLLIATTSVEKICYALRMLHMPKTVVTIFLLIYRYIVVLLKEAQRLLQAYELRAPGQKGIHWKAWGPALGQLLLRSIDRAQLVYESMQMRGFDGEFPSDSFPQPAMSSLLYGSLWVGGILVWRLFYAFG